MNAATIDALLTKRDKILTRRDSLIDSRRIAAIDAKLNTVPAGQDNRVDLALGRPCAKLPPRPMYLRNEQRQAPESWLVSAAVTLEEITQQHRIAEQLEAVKKDWLAIRGDTDI